VIERRGLEGGLRVNVRVQHGQGDQRRTGKPSGLRERGEAKIIEAQRVRGEAFAPLGIDLGCNHAGDDGQREPMRLRAPRHQRVPDFRLTRDQPSGRIGAVAAKICFSVSGDVIGQLVAAARRPVDGGEGKLGQRHRGWRDVRALRVPLRRNGFGER
jgi:hypothetical protein